MIKQSKGCFFLLLYNPMYSQNCNCLTSFDSLHNSITKNYIGYKYKINKLNKVAFESLTNKIRNKALSANIYQCHKLMQEWVNYFSDPHLSVYWNYSDSLFIQIKEYYKTDLRIAFDSAHFEKYYNSKKNDPVEGKWISRVSRTLIGVMRDKSKKREFVGFMLQNTAYLDKGKIFGF